MYGKTPSLLVENEEEKVNNPINPHITQLIKNFYIEEEILQRQGFDGVVSRKNIDQTRKNLIAGFDYIHQHAKSVDDSFLQEKPIYEALKGSKLGIMRDEANLFALITTSLTIQHASTVDAPCGASLKSIRQREISGETVENKRTSSALGRQNFVYFVTGIGNQVNAPGLHELTTYQIDLNQLALHNPLKFSQLHVSPHLSEFKNNTYASPCLMGSTRLDIQFDGQDQTITYQFQRSKECVLKKIYHLNDFVFFGGEDVLIGIALRFMELLRFVGNPYRQTLLERLADPVLSKQDKLRQLSTAMSLLMPGSMVIEAKIPQEIQLDDTYTKVITEITSEYGIDGDRDNLSPSPLTDYLKQYAVEFMPYAGINTRDKDENEIKTEFANLIDTILDEMCFNGPYYYDRFNSSGSIPQDLNLFAFKLLHSQHDLSLPLMEWLLTAKFVSPDDNQLHYLFNINQRESLGTKDLFLALLSVRWKRKNIKNY